MNFRIPFPHITSSLPDFIVSLMFLITWIEPTALGGNMLNTMAVVIFLEFFIIHSAAFMTAVFFLKKNLVTKIILEIGLGLFYSIFVIAFTSGIGTWWPLGSFWILIGNRMLTLLSGPPLKGNNIIAPVIMWGVSVFFYVIGIFIFESISVPGFGITAEHIKTFAITEFWISQPASIMTFGLFYFFCVGTVELVVMKKLHVQMRIP